MTPPDFCDDPDLRGPGELGPERRVRERIESAGRITFAEFMEEALYGRGGYYTRPGRIDPEGDYFTSPSLHPAFGALVAVQLRDFWGLLGRPGVFDAVEFGPGDGTLARDVVRYAQQFDETFAAALRYTEFDRTRSDSGAPPTGVTGCVLSNELLDAFPVHRFVIEGGSVLELYVVAGDGGLTEAPGPVSDPAIEQRVAPLIATLPDGYRGEVNLGLRSWADRVAETLERGFVLTIDYGETARELYRPGRSEGSLRAYYRHTLSQNPFQHVGDQDLTAHVDFSAVDSELSRAGFEALGMTTQTAFLDRLGLRSFLGNLPGLGLPAGEVERNRVPMLWLARPDGLGRFNVAFHTRGVDARPPIGLDSRGSGHDPSALPTPLLARDEGRFDLAGRAYPDGGWSTGTWSEILGDDEANTP
ncbi:MAG: SAM-dependent methyltransferase [Chloroflexi bacterium]|nr:SAM-dependent methyltransferase [Chloroflexota bacterium]